jgi:hypothetical protein
MESHIYRTNLLKSETKPEDIDKSGRFIIIGSKVISVIYNKCFNNLIFNLIFLTKEPYYSLSLKDGVSPVAN